MTDSEDEKDDKVMQAAWEQLTILMLRKGYGFLWMKYFLHDEFNKLCDDPVMRARIGVEPQRGDGEASGSEKS